MQTEPRRALAQTGALLMLGALLSSAVILPIVGAPAYAQDPAEDATPAEDAPPADEAPADDALGGDTPPEPVAADSDNNDAGEAAFPVEESPWSGGLVTSMLALGVGGVSAVLGIWVDRDKERPVAFAMIMSILITAAITVGATQSYLDAVSAIQHKQDLARMLNMVDEIAAASGDAALAELVQAEKAE